MICYQHTNTAGLEIADDLLQIKHGDRVDSRKRFVEQNKHGIDAQRAGNFHAPPLSPGQSISPILPDMLQPKLIDQLFHLFPALMPGDGLGFQHGKDVFLNC